MNKKQIDKLAEKAAHKLEDKKVNKSALKIILFYVVFFFGLVGWATSASAADLELTYYAKSEHFSSLPFNEEHRFYGLEYRNDQRGVGVARFKNSYRRYSNMLSYTEYYQRGKFEFSAGLGIATKYDHGDECTKNKYCPVPFVAVSYTKYKYVRPKLSVFGGALVFSLSARF